MLALPPIYDSAATAFSVAADQHSVTEKWDPCLTRRVVDLTRLIVKTYFRSQVTGLENIPAGASLMVANHSGGMVNVDLSVMAVDYYSTFGYDRPLYALAHDNLFLGPVADFLERTGVIRATPEHAAEALATGGVVLVFPGGDYDVYRPTRRRTSSRSADVPAMSPRQSRPAYPSFLRCPSAGRRTSCI